MEHSMESLDYAIYKLLPKMKIAKEDGCNTTRPELLKMVAHKYFIEQFNQDRRNMEESLCYYVCREAALELESVGYFTFGVRDLEAYFK